MPAIRSGQFELLRDLLKKFDPSLEIWIPHMSGACRYLSRYDWLNALYQVQLLMKVTWESLIKNDYIVIVFMLSPHL